MNEWMDWWRGVNGWMKGWLNGGSYAITDWCVLCHCRKMKFAKFVVVIIVGLTCSTAKGDNCENVSLTTLLALYFCNCGKIGGIIHIHTPDKQVSVPLTHFLQISPPAKHKNNNKKATMDEWINIYPYPGHHADKWEHDPLRCWHRGGREELPKRHSQSTMYLPTQRCAS